MRNLLFKKMAELHKVAAKKVNEDTDLEKIKLLFNRTVPTVEKLNWEMEKYLRGGRIPGSHEVHGTRWQVV